LSFWSGLALSDLAEDVGIKAASIYYYFPGKAELAAAVAKRYWENAAAALETLLAESSDRPMLCAAILRRFAGRLRMRTVCA
jgi:AcrR family transcriptional regulator